MDENEEGWGKNMRNSSKDKDRHIERERGGEKE